MAEVLELPHLVEQHRVAQVQVRRGRVEARLDPQRPAERQPALQLVALEDFVGAAADQFEGMSGCGTGAMLSEGPDGRARA